MLGKNIKGNQKGNNILMPNAKYIKS